MKNSSRNYVPENTAPYYATPLLKLEMNAGEKQYYILPDVKDYENDDVSVHYIFGSAFTFTSLLND